MEKKSIEALTLNVDTIEALANMEKLRAAVEATAAALERLNALLPAPGTFATTVNNVVTSTAGATLTDAERQEAIEEGWRNCVGYLAEAPSKTKYQMDVPERTGADVLWRELTIARQRGVTGKEPDTRVEMLERFSPRETEIIAAVRDLMQTYGRPRSETDTTGAHAVTRLVVQSLLYGPDAALKSKTATE